MTTKTAKEWYRLFRALFVQLLGDPEDKGALSRIVIYDPESRALRSLADASESWLLMDRGARARYLVNCLEDGDRLFLYAPEDDRPHEVLWKEDELTLSAPIELSAPDAPKKPGLLSRMLDGDASARFEEKTAAYEKEVLLTEAAAEYAPIRREQYDADRSYQQNVYIPLAEKRVLEAEHDLCAHEIDILWNTLFAGRERYIELFSPDVSEEIMPRNRTAAAAMGITLADKGMVLINYLVGEEPDEEEKADLIASAANARKTAGEAFRALEQGDKEQAVEMIRQSIKLGVGMWQGVRVFNSPSALTIGMYLSDLLECVEEEPEIENCTLLERIDMVEAESAACMALAYKTFVSACEELLADQYAAGTPQRTILALRAVTLAAAIIDLNAAGRAVYQIFDPVAMERATSKRRLFARGLEAVVTQYYHPASAAGVFEDLIGAGKETMPQKLTELCSLHPQLMQPREDAVPGMAPALEQLHDAILRSAAEV